MSRICSLRWPDVKRRAPAIAVASVVMMLVSTPVSVGQSPQPVVRVEEDWQLTLEEPDDTDYAPQLHTVMAATGSLGDLFFQVTWNYQELPEFQPGGLQVQAWEGDSSVFDANFRSAPFSTSAETITWTQALETNGSTVTFSIENGQSTTWGAFGLPVEPMGVQVPAQHSGLEGYSPNVSANSAITFGANRVESLMITQVRYFGPDGPLFVDPTPRIIHESPD